MERTLGPPPPEPCTEYCSGEPDDSNRLAQSLFSTVCYRLAQRAIQPATLLTITSVDDAPEDLYDQLPLVAELIRQLPGDDRPDFSLGALQMPIRRLAAVGMRLVPPNKMARSLGITSADFRRALHETGRLGGGRQGSGSPVTYKQGH